MSLLLAAAPAVAQEPPDPSQPPVAVPPPAAPVTAPAPPPTPPSEPFVPPTIAPFVAAPQPFVAPPVPVAHDNKDEGPANWYGWQTLIAIAPFDIAMFAGLTSLDTTGGVAAFSTGFIGRTLAPVVVHMAHRRFGAAFGSFGLHAGMSAAGLAIAYGIGIALEPPCQPINPCRNHFQKVPADIQYGPVVGSMSATVLDVVFFGYRQKLSWTASAPVAPQKTAWIVAPYMAPAPTGATGGVAAAGIF